MATGVYYLTPVFYQAHKRRVMPLVYTTTVDGITPPPQDVASYLADEIVTHLMPFLSEHIVFAEVEYVAANVAGSGTHYTGDIVGEREGDVLPVFLAFGVTKVVEPPENQSGIIGAPIKRGAMRISGIPEAVQNNRRIVDNDWYIGILGGLNALVALALPGLGTSLKMHVVRLQDGGISLPPAKAAEVVSIIGGKIGTQNTAKD